MGGKAEAAVASQAIGVKYFVRGSKIEVRSDIQSEQHDPALLTLHSNRTGCSYFAFRLFLTACGPSIHFDDLLTIGHHPDEEYQLTGRLRNHILPEYSILQLYNRVEGSRDGGRDPRWSEGARVEIFIEHSYIDMTYLHEVDDTTYTYDIKTI